MGWRIRDPESVETGNWERTTKFVELEKKNWIIPNSIYLLNKCGVF
jgi:hypothetical protein